MRISELADGFPRWMDLVAVAWVGDEVLLLDGDAVSSNPAPKVTPDST